MILTALTPIPCAGSPWCAAHRARSRPVVNQGLGWKVIDHLALNYLSLSEGNGSQAAAALREMLTLYAMHADDESRLIQVAGLLAVRTKPIARRLPMAGPIAFARTKSRSC